MRFHWLTEDTLLVSFGEVIDDAINARVHALAGALRKNGAVEVVPGFASLAVRGPSAECQVPSAEWLARESWAEAVERRVRELAESMVEVESEHGRVVEIPVCYEGEFAPDLADVAAATGLGEPEVIRRHTEPIYRVHALGFSPGFAYLAGLDPGLALPRRATPRTRVEPGSVGIGGGQTGIYPAATPGGWHLLGRTGRRLFRPEDAVEPTLLRPGDGVRFVPISRSEFVFESLPPVESVREGNVEVLRPGLLTTIQAGPRTGLAHLGVGSGGATDWLSLAAANYLLGNAWDEPALECTLVGPRLRFLDPAQMVVAGAEGALTIDGQAAPLAQVVEVPEGSVVDLGSLRRGCRAIFAVAGGFDALPVLGSASTDLAGEFGGHLGRALRAGDRLRQRFGWNTAPGAIGRSLRTTWDTSPLRFIPGPEARAGLAGQTFRVSLQSDRRGVRLQGSPLATGSGVMVSGPVRPGTVQLPPDGLPIVLGVDAQTLGGYPRIAQVIQADLPRLAQLAPGAEATFEEVTLETARAAWARQLRDLRYLGTASWLAM